MTRWTGPGHARCARPTHDRLTLRVEALEDRLLLAPLQAGDANQDGQFDPADITQVLKTGTYQTGLPAQWGDGDWDGAPGGEPSNPPLGNGFFDQQDLLAALEADFYMRGPYAPVGPPQHALAAILPGGLPGDGSASIVYDAATGQLSIDPPAGQQLTSIHIRSASGLFSGAIAQNLSGPFDVDTDADIFKATFGFGFGPISLGPVAPPGLTQQQLVADLVVDGSLAAGGGIGPVDLVYAGINSPPLIGPIPAQQMLEDTTLGPLPLTIADDLTPSELLHVSAAADNPLLVPGSGILLANQGGNWIVTVTPAPHLIGTATITITVRDESSAAATSSFMLTVNSLPDRDGDGLPDVWETVGLDGLALPELGANPDRFDIFVEVDALDGFAPEPLAEPAAELAAAGLASGTVLDRVVEAFLRTPLLNPDGSTGVYLHLLLDDLGIDASPYGAQWSDASQPWAGFEAAKQDFFGTESQRGGAGLGQHLLGQAGRVPLRAVCGPARTIRRPRDWPSCREMI